MAAVEEELRKIGWYLTTEGIKVCSDGLDDKSDVKAIIKRALDLDFKSIGDSILPDDINKGKREQLPGGCVLQIVKVMNISAPRANEESGAAPRLLKVHLTDGQVTCIGLDLGCLKCIDLNTPPGTKVRLKGNKVVCNSGFLILDDSNVEVLGGKVEALIEKWQLNRTLNNYNYKRTKVSGDGGAPLWVPFGHKIETGNAQDSTGKFKSINAGNKESKENDAFEEQRKATIAEAARAKIPGRKVFGGGKQVLDRESSDKDETGGKYDMRNANENAAANASNHKSYNTKYVNDVFVAQNTKPNHESGDRRDSAKPRRENQGRGKNSKKNDDEETPQFTAPSRPSTLFDFLESKMATMDVKPAAGSTDWKEFRPESSSNSYKDNRSNVHRNGNQYGVMRNGSFYSNERGNNSRSAHPSSSSNITSNKEMNQNHYRQNRKDNNFPKLGGSSTSGNFNGRGRQQQQQQQQLPSQQKQFDTSPKPNWASLHNLQQGFVPVPSLNDSLSKNAPQTQYKRNPPTVTNPTGRSENQNYSTTSSDGTTGTKYLWKSGDECLAKYWEDNKFYPAVVHAVANNGATCVIQFCKYDNYEEVLVTDMRPLNHNSKLQGLDGYQSNTGGTIEFRRGGTRPYIFRSNSNQTAPSSSDRGGSRNSNRPAQQVYVPPAQRQI